MATKGFFRAYQYLAKEATQVSGPRLGGETMSESILNSTKKVLGIAVEYTAFDEDIIMHINSVFSTVNQLGIGPPEGFEIVDASAVWSDLIGDDTRMNSVKTYTYLRVRLMFDPPTTSYLITSVKTQIEELEWRMNALRESYAWVSPTPEPQGEDVYDGGDP